MTYKSVLEYLSSIKYTGLHVVYLISLKNRIWSEPFSSLRQIQHYVSYWHIYIIMCSLAIDALFAMWNCSVNFGVIGLSVIRNMSYYYHDYHGYKVMRLWSCVVNQWVTFRRLGAKGSYLTLVRVADRIL